MAFRKLPTALRRIGFELDAPSAVEIQPAGEAVRCLERRADGTPVGELEVSAFQAALVIDRDGILEERVRAAANDAAEPGGHVLEAVPVELPGASGFRADIELVAARGTARPALPYVHVFAMASNDLAVDGGVLVTVRSATPEWPAADHLLRTLRILSRRRND